MPPDVQKEFVLAGVEAGILSEEEWQHVSKGIGSVRKAGGLPKDNQVRRAVLLKRKEEEQTVAATKAKAPAEVVLNEKNKEHIKIILNCRWHNFGYAARHAETYGIGSQDSALEPGK